MLKRLMNTESHEYFVWLDGDAAILDHEKPLEAFIRQAGNIRQACELNKSPTGRVHLVGHVPRPVRLKGVTLFCKRISRQNAASIAA